MKINYQKRWKFLVIAMLLLFVLQFSPLIIPLKKYKPMFFGIPYSLFWGFLGTILGVVLTYIAAKIHAKVYERELK